MDSTARIDRHLAATLWPPLSNFSPSVFQAGDILIVSGGFEDRVFAVLVAAQKAGVRELNVIGIEYKPSIEQNKHAALSELCSAMGWNHNRLLYDRCNPQGVYESLRSLIPNNDGKLYIDISGMSRLLIIQLLTGLLEDAEQTTSTALLYTEAAHYPPTETEAAQVIQEHGLDAETVLSFISAGVHEIAVVPELSSTNLHRNPIRLVAFPSFNPSQLIGVRSTIQPAHITLIHGTPPNPLLAWRKKAICDLNRIDEALDSESLSASTLDYTETLHALLQLYDRWSYFNSLVISPTGSKMQSVAVGLFKAFISDVQIVYPTPLRFTNPDSHTTGVGATYLLPLDPFINLRRQIMTSEP